MCEPLGTCRVESIAGENTTITIGFERLRLEEIRPAKFVVATVREHAGWLEPEWIDGIFFNTHSAIELREESMPTNSAGRDWSKEEGGGQGAQAAQLDRTITIHHRRYPMAMKRKAKAKKAKKNPASATRRKKK
jgi:hypothetical protein